jgi:minor extracellular serine protease Vpr
VKRLTRHGTLLFGIVLVALAVVATGSAGATQRATGIPGGPLTGIKPAVTPFGMSNKPMTVVVQLAGNPIVAADADSKDSGKGGLTRAEKQALRDQLKAKQAPVAQNVQALGGTVLASYQAAYNGLKVRIASRKGPELEAIPGVVGVHRVPIYRQANVHGIPLIGAPQAWDGANGFHGEGIKIAVIDTGIDYTHADFGGLATAAAWNYAKAHNTIDPATDPQLASEIGPNAPRVKGGTDLVGDDYNADPTDPNYQPVPHPDPNPLDCNGHGSHVAGTAAGSGVLSDGSTYTGPYNASTVSGHSWNVGPGVAPKADIYSIRVFGCEGSTDVVVDAIEWAVDHGMDVINMSLGSPWGTKDSADAVAVDNAARDGVIVVSSSGNEGHAPYMTGSPGTATRGISVAATDPTASFPGATLHLSTGTDVQAIDANGFAPLPHGPFPVKVIWANAAHTQISLGCSVADDVAGGAAGKYIVVARGTCARVAKAIYGQQAGAIGVIMVNTSNAFPPYEGTITSNPDTGEQFTVTIPFLGVKSSSAGALAAADGGTTTVDPLSLANPTFKALADFSSFGPRTGDSWLKPDVSAPGVSISSVGMGTGTGAAILSGTSMAAPHTTGMSALVKQAHPKWKKVEYWKAAVVNTADPGGVAGYSTRGSGAGFIQAYQATHTDAIALGDKGTATLNFGLKEIDKDYVSDRVLISVINFGDKKATFNVAATLPQGSPHSISLSKSSVTVQGGGNGSDIGVRLTVPVATAGDSSAFHDVAGLITLTPASSSDNNGITIRVPYYLVPQAVSHVAIGSGVGDAGDKLTAGDNPVTLTNKKGAATGTADWYAWGLKEGRSKGLSSDDLISAGAQSYPSDGIAVFSLSVARPWSNPAETEYDVFVDVNGDGTPDYDVVSVDLGLVTAGTANGQAAVAVFSLATGDGSIEFLTQANFNGNSMVLPVLFDQLCQTGTPCITAGTPISYTVAAFSETDGTSDDFGGATASYDLFHPAFTTANGGFDTIAPNATVNDTVTIDGAQWNTVNPLGLLVISQNNPSRTGRSDADQGGNSEAMTLKVKIPKK